MKPALRKYRIINFVIDLFVVLVIWQSVGALLVFGVIDFKSFYAEKYFYSNGGPLRLFIYFYSGYYFLLELILSKTVGKLLTRTIVVKENGDRPTIVNLLVRTFFRLLLIEWFSFFKKNPIGWHDSAAECIVVKQN